MKIREVVAWSSVRRRRERAEQASEEGEGEEKRKHSMSKAGGAGGAARVGEAVESKKMGRIREGKGREGRASGRSIVDGVGGDGLHWAESWGGGCGAVDEG